LLRQAGYQSSRAADGRTAVRLALENVPDLILCDLDLPGMDGYEVANALRADRSWRVVPVVAFTAGSTGDAQNEVLASGFTGYISKPIDPRTFIATLTPYLAPDLRAS
jgi:CheY-like chemotaxis protein